jgi:hypothetical protein
MMKNKLRSTKMKQVLKDTVFHLATVTNIKNVSTSPPRDCEVDRDWIFQPTKDWNEHLTKKPIIDSNKNEITLEFKKEYAKTRTDVSGVVGLNILVYFFPSGAKVEDITCKIDNNDKDEDNEDGENDGDGGTHYYNETPIEEIGLNENQVEEDKPLIYSNKFDPNKIKKIERLYVSCKVQYDSEDKFSFYVDLP